MMEKRAKFSVWYYLIVFGTIFLMDSLFFSGYAVKEISYSDFRDRLAAGQIERVVITEKKIHGTMKSPDSEKTGRVKSGAGKEGETFSPVSKHTPWRLRLKELKAERERKLKQQFVVTRLDDKKLVEDLQSHGVDYRGKINSNWLQNLFFNWIIPIGLFVVIWGFFVKRMGGGPDVLNIGKNKAKIYAEDVKNKITFNDVAGIDEAVEEVKEIVSFLKEP
ncbi:MAG: ATP-dependent metallopeptidase FtsH/Yme1/Tma family protein, partial [Nitrospirota bacterium]|nr:ATP-dependent metallopeptidase FtsH/Yme1/Tma family protein [Nitrospirota bacterium]